MSGYGGGGRRHGGGGRGGGGRGGGGRGRGAYYKAKYGGGRGGGGGGRGGGGRAGGGAGRGGPEHADRRPDGPTRGWDELFSALTNIDGRPYPAYKDLYGSFAHPSFLLRAVHIQGDAFAAPSRFSLTLRPEAAAFPAELLQSDVRRRALCDYVTRAFYHNAKALGVDVARGGGGWKGVKGGDMQIARPSQHVLDRSAAAFRPGPAPGQFQLEVRFTVALPAAGRSICGKIASEVLCRHLPDLVARSVVWQNINQQRATAHVLAVEDQVALRAAVAAEGSGMVAFVRTGALLPRASGVDDRPMAGKDAVPFASPESLRQQLQTPNAGVVEGMAVPPGVTVIVGGGFHGKSTLLRALEVGVYDHVPGDGRDGVVTHPGAVKIRSEDGRQVSNVDISGFISQLPVEKDTTSFSTKEASGSTSQAANIAEALEVGSRVLLIDEDTAATNFMMRDRRMEMLVKSDPITPYIARCRELWETFGVSSVLVVGGAGDYLAAADTVICMEAYRASDVTAEAKAIVRQTAQGAGVVAAASPLAPVRRRVPLAAGFRASSDRRPLARRVDAIQFGRGEDEETLALTGLEQLVEVGQSRALASSLAAIATRFMTPGKSMAALMDDVEAAIEQEGLDVLCPGFSHGGLSRPRRFELAGVLNRYRAGHWAQLS